MVTTTETSIEDLKIILLLDMTSKIQILEDEVKKNGIKIDQLLENKGNQFQKRIPYFFPHPYFFL